MAKLLPFHESPLQPQILSAMNMLRKSVVLLIFLCMAVIASAQNNKPNIIPLPQHWEWQNGSTNISQLTTIVLGNGTNEQDRFTAQQIQADLSEYYHIKADIKTERTVTNGNNSIIIGNPNNSDLVDRTVKAAELTSKMDTAGYILKIENNSAVIAGKSVTGRFYGAMSLIQLLEANGSGNLRNISISDYPAMKFRGLSDDMSRGQVSTEDNIKRIIRFMALYKMNTYMPYIEDLIHFRDYPGIGKNRGAFTEREIQELQDYANKYHVQIIPIFESLGHQENMLNMPKFLKYAEYPGAASFNTQDSSAIGFLKHLLGETIPMFHSQYFHIGGDESFDVGLGASKKAVNRYGLATVNARYYRKVYDYVKSHGKKVMMYGDMLLRNPDVLSQLPKDIIIFDWHYGASDEFPSTEVFARAHQPFVASPGISNWSRLYPNQSAAWINTYNFTLEGYKNGALGSITTSWGDMGGPNFRELNYRGYAYDAECAWNPLNADQSTIDTRFDNLFFGSNSPQLAAIQNLLNGLSEDIYYPEVWRQPFDRLNDFENNRHLPLLNTTLDIKRSSIAVERLTASIKPKLKRNAYEMDYDAFAAELAHWVGESLEFSRWMQRISQDNIYSADREPFTARGIKWGSKLGDQIAGLQKKFDELWLRTNKKDNLAKLDTLFEYQKLYLDQIVDSLKQNIWDTSYEIPSRFIAANDASDSNAIPSVCLRKSFPLTDNGKIKHAWLQVVGDSYVTVWLNGHKLGRIYAKREGSLGIDLRRSKYWDVTKLLTDKSENVIAARATSYMQIPESEKKTSVYSKDRPGSANIYLKIEYADGNTQTILTDQYWKSHVSEEKGWTKPGFDDSYWLPATVVSGPATVYKPLFEHELPSFVRF
ncbi:MAG TPA: family 20 glycosylhydrolase [Balneolales bacterium]|nr:family 20 glycosylhydrolase [Balneolales bacterium]